MPDPEQPTPKRRFFIAYPPGYADMSDEEKKEACGAINNTATYWGTNPAKTNWTLNLHCTSDLSKASIQNSP